MIAFPDGFDATRELMARRAFDSAMAAMIAKGGGAIEVRIFAAVFSQIHRINLRERLTRARLAEIAKCSEKQITRAVDWLWRERFLIRGFDNSHRWRCLALDARWLAGREFFHRSTPRLSTQAATGTKMSRLDKAVAVASLRSATAVILKPRPKGFAAPGRQFVRFNVKRRAFSAAEILGQFGPIRGPAPPS